MPGRSTTSALLSISHNCLQALDSGCEVCTIFFDIRKAFDSVLHRALTEKMRKISLHDHLLSWLHSYLSNRSQLLLSMENRLMNSLFYLEYPRVGSWASAFLGLYYNDVTSQISAGSNIVLFADDIAL